MSDKIESKMKKTKNGVEKEAEEVIDPVGTAAKDV